MNSELLDILVCPRSKGALHYKEHLQELWSKESGLAYPVRDEIPFMLVSEARKLTDAEINSIC